MKYFLLSLLSCYALQRASASNYDENLKSAAEELVTNLENRGIERIVISDFSSLETKNDELTTRISEELVIHILNGSSQIKVYERDQLDLVLAELRLQNSGLMDESTIQKAGELLGAEVLITGKYVVESSQVKIWLTALEINTGLKIGATFCQIGTYPKSLLYSNTQQKSGSLLLKNKTALSVVVVVYNDDFEKEVYLSKSSQNQINDLPPGKYTFSATYKNRSQPFFSSDVVIYSSRKTKRKIKGARSMFDRMMAVSSLGLF